MVDVSRWLAEQGLGHYAEAFAQNGIAGDILCELTDADLKQLGLNLGDRKRLLKAIATLDPETAQHRVESAKQITAPAVPREPERRQLTVMFVDLVGSTALSARLDPEDMREVIRAYQNTVAGEIERFEGSVANFMGDGVLAFFGYPKAHEDDAERAVRAGLAIAAATEHLSSPASEPLAARVGIATGLVVVGDLVGEAAAQEQAVIGETPNLAARLQTVAAPGQVVVADATRRLLGVSFDVEDVGPQLLKGFARPVAAFAITGERQVESRFEARSGLALLPMVGRDQELAVLLERWAEATAGDGRGVLLVGEAGIGKSRVSRALLDTLAEEPHFRIRYQCSPYHTESALWPVIQQMRHAAGLVTADTLEVQLDKLEALLGQANGRDAAPLIAGLIGLDAAARYGGLDLTPQAQRARTLQALVDQLLGLAAREPVLVVLEDAHWIDPTTRELIEQCLDRIAVARVLILLTSRPDNQPRLLAHPHVTRVTLNRLGRAGVEAIVARLGGDHLPSETIATIIERSDGVPLFAEELTKAVLETAETTIPASLHDSLMARLDRTPEVKEIAQIAACIGREFDYSLLAAIADRPEQPLRTDLDKLVSSELVFRRGSPPEATYSFKHALVRDAAYDSLLRSRRRQLHQAIFERQKAEGGALPEVLAYHAQEAGLVDEAIANWQAAGEHALARPAYAEALKHFETALGALRDRPESESRQRREAGLLLLIGRARIPYLGFGAKATVAAFAEAEHLTRQLREPDLRLPALFGTWGGYYVRGELPAALVQADAFWREAEPLGAVVPQMIGHRIRGVTLVVMGEVGEARIELEAARGLYDARLHVGLADRFGQEPGVATDCYLALAWALDGALDSAVRLIRATMRRLEELNHVNTTGFGLGHLGCFAAILKVSELAFELAERGLENSRRQQLPMWEGLALAGLGLCYLDNDRFSEAAAAIAESLELYRRSGSGIFLAAIYANHALALARCGRLAEAHKQLEEARSVVEHNQERWYEPEVWRIDGLLALDAGDRRSAEARFHNALTTARRFGLRPWELRAATSFARLWRDQGKRAQARDLLAPVYGWFTEGFDTADLKDAKALLEELQ
jgi:class 3 adenylate cyclase/tetratricopeptide (TPR) repeat protein